MNNMGLQMVKWYRLHGRSIGYSLGLCDVSRHVSCIYSGERALSFKYQAINIGPGWEVNKMAVYTELKSCWLDGKGWSWIKAYDAKNYGQQATVDLREHYKSYGEVNNRVVLATAKIDNENFKSKHIYSFEKFLTVLQDYFTILNKNSETGNQMVGKMPENIIVPYNL